MNKQFFTHTTLFVFLILFIFSCQHKKADTSQDFNPEDFFPRVKSSIGNHENPSAREDYWTRLQIDPKTGIIPENIRKREIAFSNTLPQKGKDPQLRTNAEEWTSIGPYNIGGRTRSIAIDATNEAIILAGGVTGGIWKTTDGGNNWSKKTAPESLHSVTSIAQDTRSGKSNIWYFGTGEVQGNSARAPFAPFRGDGIFKSIDNGESWVQLPATALGNVTKFNSQFQYIWKVITNKFEPTNDEVFAAIMGGIARSMDGGDSWQIVLGEEFVTSDNLDLNFENAPRFTDIVQTEDGVFYAVLSSEAFDGTYSKDGVYRSEDGTTWNNITPGGWPSTFSRIVIATSSSSPKTLYFLGDRGADDFLWRFTNTTGNNGNWVNLSTNIPMLGGDTGDYDDQDSYNMVLKVHPNNDEIVYLGGTNLYRSDDGFASSQNISWVGGYDTANNLLVYPNHYVDQHDLAFFRSNPDRMLSTNDGGIFVTESNRAEYINWWPLNNGFVTGQSYVLGFDPSTSFGKVIIGFQDNGTYIANNPDYNTQWYRFLGGDGGYCAISKNEKYYYASFQDGETYRFTTDKNFQRTSFARVDPLGGGEKDGQEYLFINPFVLDPNNNNIMYLAAGDAVWKNINLTQIPSGSQEKTSVNWEKLADTQISVGQISAISASNKPENIVFYGTSQGDLYKISDALAISPTIQDITSPIFPDNGYIISIAIDPLNAENILVVFSNYNVKSIYYSDNGGNDFVSVSGNLEEFPDGSGSGPSVRWVDVAPTRDGKYIYFAATSTGVYSTENLDGDNTIWTREGGSTLGNVVSVMVKHRASDGTVYAATHGNGAFQATFNQITEPTFPIVKRSIHIGTAFPNPFETSTKIPFFIMEDGPTYIGVYDIQGRRIRDLLNAYEYRGNNFVTWDGTNQMGTPVSTGTYIIRMFTNGKTYSTKIVYVSSL